MKALIAIPLMLALITPVPAQNQNPPAPGPSVPPANPRVLTQPRPSTAPVVNPSAAQAFPTNAQMDPITRSNNLAAGHFGIAEVQEVMVELQGTIDMTLPVLGRLTSGNAGIDPSTGLPRQIVNTAVTGQTPSAYVGTAGTNIVQLDPQTYQALIVLQHHLQQARLTLRDLNAAERLLNAAQNAQPLTPTGAQQMAAPQNIPPAAPQTGIPPNRPPQTPTRPATPPPRQRILQPGTR